MSVALRTYFDERTLPFHFCPGCSHRHVLERLNEALVALQPDPRNVVIVTDIGCVGLSDRYFITNAFHGLHGRAVTYATGLKLANPELLVIVLIGDGGCGIGAHHLIHAARRNIGVTVLVFNNLNFGMTGGEHSATTPPGAVTSTTSLGNLEAPMDICATVAVNGASFVARATAFDPMLSHLIAQAIQVDGFSLVDIWELCTAYYVPHNRFSRARLEQVIKDLHLPTGVIAERRREEYAKAYRASTRDLLDQEPFQRLRLEARYPAALRAKLSVVLAGAAGQKVRTAGRFLGLGATLSGLYATQRDEYPVTVMTGHSVSEVLLSPEPILYTGIPKPDHLLILAEEGLRQVRGKLAGLSEKATVHAVPSLLPIPTQARVIPLDVEGRRGITKKTIAVAGVARFIQHTQIYPLEALKEAIRISQPPEIAQEHLAAVEAATSF
ncbi:MAG: thiamine pyrophosphate-dependent enzyme [Armatimonadota bacterium]|nr:thiamine pyrophosphate-dependent enzyme [Armatimonadota bacterium]